MNKTIVVSLPQPKKSKRRQGIFYILKSKNGVYKYGYTRNNVRSRRNYAQKVMGEDFEIIYTRIVSKPNKFENRFKWLTINDVILLGGRVEYFAVPSDSSLDLIAIAESLE